MSLTPLAMLHRWPTMRRFSVGSPESRVAPLKMSTDGQPQALRLGFWLGLTSFAGLDRGPPNSLPSTNLVGKGVMVSFAIVRGLYFAGLWEVKGGER